MSVDRVGLAMTVGPCQDWLEDAVHSVMRSTFKRWQLLVWPDGVDIAVPMPDDPRVIVAPNNGKLGRNMALAAALHALEAPLIGWVDADDLLGEEALGATVGLLHDNPDSPMAVTGMTEFAKEGDVWRIQGAVPPKPFVRGGQPLSLHFALIRKGAYESAGRIRPTLPLAMDVDLLLRLEEQGRVVADNRTDHYFWRQHPGSLGALNRRKQAVRSGEATREALKRRENLPCQT